MVEVDDENLHGKFFGGDSYVIRYTYQNSEGRDAYIVYFWQVSNNLPIQLRVGWGISIVEAIGVTTSIYYCELFLLGNGKFSRRKGCICN